MSTNMEYRIYIDDTLVMCCTGEYAAMCNYVNYKKEFGDRIIAKHVPAIMDDEKKEWLQQMFPSDMN